MSGSLSTEIVTPDALGPSERAAWIALRAANPALDSPYFDIRYTEAAAGVPHARVAILRRGGDIRGFFPFQKRGRLVQPLGAPLSDYHGIIAAPDEVIDLASLTRELGASRLRVNGWAGSVAEPGWVPRRRMTCDLSGGAEGLDAAFEARDHKFCKNMRRQHRGLERDHGPVTFKWDDRDPVVFDWIIARKREQYARTRRHDVFRCGWTADLLRRLFDTATADFGIRVASLRTATGEIIAAEISLQGDGVLHLWFPAYAEAYRRYGPGALATRLELAAAAAAGLHTADFGCGEESYKSTFAEPGRTVFEGTLSGALSTATAGMIQARAPVAVRRLAGSVERRLDIINACETRFGGWVSGTVAAAAAAAARQGG
ncbi:GNAT family N-acetyltransferase [uncultured Brevundimonas sp.]|uniref:GNAT family N-acetyltransferase n=1 Tax=uncultured Brevundimonas sp. TaxID=213418 RepID=UPI0030EE704B